MTFLVLMNIYLIGGIMYVRLSGWNYIQELIRQLTGSDDDMRCFVNDFNRYFPNFAKAIEMDDVEHGIAETKRLYNGKHAKLWLGMLYIALFTVYTLLWPIWTVSHLEKYSYVILNLPQYKIVQQVPFFVVIQPSV